VITVHYLENSRAHRLVWLLEEMGLDYTLRLYRRDGNLLAPPELKQVHPLGKSPVLEEDAIVLAESGAIFEYLLGRHGSRGLAPPVESADWPAYLYYLHAAEGSAMPLLVNRLTFNEVKRRAPWFARPVAAAIAGRLDRMLVARTLLPMFDAWAVALAATGWFAGAFSAADIMMSYPVQAAVRRAAAADGRPALGDFLRRCAERPAFQRALAKGAFEMP